MLFKPAQDIYELRYIVANVLSINDQTISITIKYAPLSYWTGSNRKRSEQSMNADHKSLEAVFSFAICRQSGDKRQSKTVSNNLRSMFVDSNNVFDCRLSEVFIEYRPTEYVAKPVLKYGY